MTWGEKMRTGNRLIVGLAISAALLLVLPESAYGELQRLMKAFAFGKDDWTRATYNDPHVSYLKVSEDCQSNWFYSPAQGHGYLADSVCRRTTGRRSSFAGASTTRNSTTGSPWTTSDCPEYKFRHLQLSPREPESIGL
jgi:hypothetical protein